MPKAFQIAIVLILITAPVRAQTKRLWVLRSSGEMIEYDPSTFATRQTVKVPAEAAKNPANLDVNREGHILFVPTVSLPLSEEDASSPHKIWFWNGHAASNLDQGIQHKAEATGSNQAITESAPSASLSADGAHLYWFANESRRLQREQIDLSTSTTWKAWRTDLQGAGREDLASTKFPDCSCPTGSCEESCPFGVAWTPDEGVDRFFLLNQFVSGQTATVYKASTRFDAQGGKWISQPLSEPMQRVLDTDESGNIIVEAIPDTGCCGWSNQSNDQTLVWANGNRIVVFDEQAAYKNPDYDVSFFTANARLSPDDSQVAMTITATTQPNKAIQESEQGQANLEEARSIRKALLDLPAVAVKKIDDVPKQIAFAPHAVLVGWINAKELLIVEDHLLEIYNVTNGARRKSSVRVEDALHIFLR